MNPRAIAIGLGTLALVGAFNPGCDCGSQSGATGTGCGSDCNQPCQEPLPMGLIGSYTSVGVAKDGTTWVSGYNDAVINPKDIGTMLYGDLVVGKYDSGKKLVQWSTVDGLPPAPTDGTCPDNDPKGWRGGLLDAGPDVGLWTNLQLDPSDHPMVVYYDATNQQAKFAFFDGTNWTNYVLSAKVGADIGRYAKMIIGTNGNPVVAFLGMEPGTTGNLHSRVIVGHATANPPTSASAWTFEDAAVDDSGPCTGTSCKAGQVCVKSTGACTATVSGCTPSPCASGNDCVAVSGAPTCTATIAAGALTTYPDAYGDYISLANGPQGLGMAIYDRIHGNLIALTNAGGKWAAQTLDGETGTSAPNNTGDDGIAASLFIAPNGDWHVAYVNGIKEQLQYLIVPGGGMSKPFPPEVVDDGSNSGNPYPDGIHIIGDDASIQVDSGGTVTVVYQDSTAGALRYASGVPSGATHKWTARTVAQQTGFAGFFPRFVTGPSQVTNFFRKTDHTTGDITGDVAFVSP